MNHLLRKVVIKKIPRYPNGHWFSGCFKQFRKSNLFFPAQVGRELGGIGKFRIFHRQVISVTDSALYDQIMVKNHLSFVRGIHFKNTAIIFGNGLLFTEGEVWLRTRLRSNPAFNRESLKKVVPLTSKDTNMLLEKWAKYAASGEKVDVNYDLQLISVSIICHALFSNVMNDESGAELCSLFRESSMVIRKRNSNLFPHPSWLPSKSNRQLKMVRDELNNFVSRLIRERDLLAKDRPLNDIFEQLIKGRKFDDLSKNEKKEILDECKTLFVAGFETTSLTVTWVLYLLAKHPEVAQKWHAECDAVLQGKDDPTWEDLEKLEYTKSIVFETMRLYPVVFNQPRVCVKSEVVGGYKFHKGDVVLLSIYGIHHSDQYWDNPEVFDPDRFGAGVNWPKQHFMPFGKGKHTCIGNNFSVYETLVILSMLGKKFSLSYEEVDKVEPSSTVVLIPNKKVMLRLHKRI